MWPKVCLIFADDRPWKAKRPFSVGLAIGALSCQRPYGSIYGTLGVKSRQAAGSRFSGRAVQTP